jgi:hypothetical protein
MSDNRQTVIVYEDPQEISPYKHIAILKVISGSKYIAFDIQQPFNKGKDTFYLAKLSAEELEEIRLKIYRIKKAGYLTEHPEQGHTEDQITAIKAEIDQLFAAYRA